MAAFLFRRLLSSIVVLFFAVSLTFLLTRTLPGGPFDKEKASSAQVQEALLEKYKLNGSLWEQYTAYLRDLVRLDLRVSFKYRDWSVAEILGQKMPTSLKLGGVAFLIASVLGVFIGSLAAMKRDTTVDWAAMFGAILAISIPSFITGPFLIAVFALWLGWLPVGGWGTIGHLILPACCLAAPYVAYVARLMRNSLLDVLKSDFLRTAKAKGLTSSQALVRHAMKVAILPVVTYLGPLAAHLLTGSMIVESVFNISGAGSIFVNAIQNRDAFLLCGAVVIYCTLLIVFNLIVDLLYSVLDKRIQLHA
ncbi:oligopeptide transport system permease protein [Prosthecobacter fusiformis]|uniref:Oligopeptide transport system permease protein n=1 Tax=Prosthecobacter fusiformis TaxID=48464 RepID=A0A4R7SRE8_9BACT|nr:ABC transporter permease [Prosthecobacter fusiformis]TDU81832.1 oligopeptide transport system permease protein [Prosthecobacter fusiformis]